MDEKVPLVKSSSQNILHKSESVQTINGHYSVSEDEKDYDRRNVFSKFWDFIRRKKRYFARTIFMNGNTEPHSSFCNNSINNRKYSLIFFIFQFLYEQFKYFANMYYLLTALSQFVPYFKVGYLFTYIAPLIFVLSITLVKEMWDDIFRWTRDREINSEKYEKLLSDGSLQMIRSSNIKVGDLIKIKTDQRVPADCVLIKTSEKSGSSFIRTSSLDGETDWKLRYTIPYFQTLPNDIDLFQSNANFYVDAPKKEIYEFFGRCTYRSHNNVEDEVESLDLGNTIWANTHIATGNVIGLVVYTGNETRNVLNKQDPVSKVGKLDKELNRDTKLLFFIMFILSLACVLLKKQFEGILLFIASFVRFLILFSSIIPISLRVNMDISKSIYSILINFDKKIRGTVVRNSSIPEELGRINHLFCDKTGTLTQNVMIFKKIVMFDETYNNDDIDRMRNMIGNVNLNVEMNVSLKSKENSNSEEIVILEKNEKEKETKNKKLKIFIESIALCHNVTPRGSPEITQEENEKKKGKRVVIVSPIKERDDDDDDDDDDKKDGIDIHVDFSHAEGVNIENEVKEEKEGVKYEASSPDEIALVKFSESVGLTLYARTTKTMTLRNDDGILEHYDILLMFPFTSADKRMGIFVRSHITKKIVFYMKGADAVMKKVVKKSDWLMEEVNSLAKDGLRTLVFAMKTITQEEYDKFLVEYKAAKSSLIDRVEKIGKVRKNFEKQMELLGVTGVEDLLQENVQNVLENIRNAGIKVWMLTGDKIETAICISRSTRLVDKHQEITKLTAKTQEEMENLLTRHLHNDSDQLAIVLDGNSLQIALDHFQSDFIKLTNTKCTSVICARCAPTQKAMVVRLVKKKVKGITTAAIGDGGNDVSMILEANVGLGIVGKEGKQASLAADFSVLQFSHIQRLILWHGTNSYRRGAKMSQFIVHRGMIISIIQAVFSALYYFATVPIFTGWLLVGYTTLYTLLPVFAICMDTEITEKISMEFPEIYKRLQKRKLLSWKNFLIWVWKACYQGGVIMILQLLLAYFFVTSSSLLRMQSIVYTSLIFTELIMIGLTSFRLNIIMIIAEFISIVIYIVSIFCLPGYFDISYVFSLDFLWKTAVIVCISCLPIYVTNFVYRKFRPTQHSKLRDQKKLNILNQDLFDIPQLDIPDQILDIPTGYLKKTRRKSKK